ncbi:S-layer homology domain-containing protein [Candidatus Peregrinibacteria bacterium]|nr:S-layer homology domain-containing protein [Candidatus Peregrinibacteria bacterium]
MKKIFLSFLIGLFSISIPAALALTTMYSDLFGDEWYANSVKDLTEEGIIKGYDDNTYRPNEMVNRAELAVMLDRLIEQERARERVCDKLAIFNDYEWFSKLNTSYKEFPSSDPFPRTDIALEAGNGCLLSPFFVFVPGQDSVGCHEIFLYDIFDDELKKADFECGNEITGINSEYAPFTGFLGEGGKCTMYKGKYFFRENKVEVEERDCGR